MNIATINFTAEPAKSCKGCICEHQRSTACGDVCRRAVACGLPDCEDGSGFIYVIAELDLVGMVEQVPTC